VRRLFALDQNFPEPIVDALADFIRSAELVPVRRIDKAFTTLPDWELLLALHRHERDWDGLITSDANMLSLPREMSILMQTKLSLVIARRQGDNPIRATGIILAQLDNICHHSRRDVAQVWELGITQKPATEPWAYMEKIASRLNVATADLYNGYKLPEHKLRGEKP
jgi:hypothetical protein